MVPSKTYVRRGALNGRIAIHCTRTGRSHTKINKSSRSGIYFSLLIDFAPEREYNHIEGDDSMRTDRIATFIRENRKAAGLTQEEFAIRAGLGLRFVHELEQGKKTVRLDKVNQALAMFGMEAVPGRIEQKAEEEQP